MTAAQTHDLAAEIASHLATASPYWRVATPDDAAGKAQFDRQLHSQSVGNAVLVTVEARNGTRAEYRAVVELVGVFAPATPEA